MTSLRDIVSGTDIQRFTYAYDPAGNRNQIEDLNGSQTDYTYDAKGRLTRDQTTGTNAHDYPYAYDSRDNRLASGETSPVTSFAYDPANRLVTAVSGSGTTTYLYDANGNLTNVADPPNVLTTMAYDKENRLREHSQNADVNTFLYDGHGLKRVEVGVTRVTLVWDGSDYLQERS